MKSLDVTKLVAFYMIGIPPGQFPTGGIPNGHLFADAMSEGVDIDIHNILLGALKGGRGAVNGKVMVKESNNYLTLTEEGEKFRERIVEVLTKELVK